MQNLDDLIKKIEEVVQPVVAEMEIDLVDLSVKCGQRGVDIQILADKPTGGITVEECTYVNKKIAKRIEQDDFIQSRYTIEVSSPGLDRPLKTKNDFVRVLGRDVHVTLEKTIDNHWELVGKTKRIEGDSIIMDCGSGDVVVPLSKIKNAVQVI